MMQATTNTRLGTSIPALNKALEGGLPKGSYNLLIAATGVGKTAVAAQLAIEWALQGHTGLYLSTSESGASIVPRFYSSGAGILYSKIKDGLTYAKLSPEESQRKDEIVTQCKDRLELRDWCHKGVRERTLRTHLIQELKEYEAKHGKPDFVVIDHLTPEVCGGTTYDLREREAHMRATGTFLAALAEEQDLLILATAQARIQSLEKKRLKAWEIQHCKRLAQEAAYFLGMSGVRNNEDLMETGIYQAEQTLSVYTGAGRLVAHVPVKRNFDYQQLAPVS